MTKALDILHQEHRAIMAVLHCFDHVLDEVKEGKLEPEFELFRTILEYMSDFPDRFHHPKEDEYLFPAVRKKSPDMEMVLDELQDQHKEGVRRLSDLNWKLDDWEEAPADKDRADAFTKLAKEYIDMQRRHAATEEKTVMQTARKALTDEEWESINAAFTDNEDPLFGNRPKAVFNKLFSRIVSLAPQPWGLAVRHAPPQDEAGDIDHDSENWSEDQRKSLLNLHWV